MLRTPLICVIAAVVLAGCQTPAETRRAAQASVRLNPLSIVIIDDKGNPLPPTEFRCGKNGSADYGDCKLPVMVLWESDTTCWALLPYNKLTLHYQDLPPGLRRIEWTISGGKDSEFTDLSLSKKNPGDPHAPDEVWDKDTSNNKVYRVSMKDTAPPRQEFRHSLTTKTKNASGQTVTCLPIDPLIVNVE